MRIILILLIALAVTKLNAQEHPLTFGSVVGFGHSWNNLDYGSKVKKINPSFNTGLRLLYSYASHFSAGVDGTFKTEGYKLSNPGFKFIVHLNYLNLDPKAWFLLGKDGKAFRPKIGVGPNFGLLVGGKIKEDIMYGQAGESKSKDYYKTFNFGLAGSVGFNYQLKGKAWLNIETAYNHGLSNVLKSGIDNMQTRSLFFNVGFTYGSDFAQKKIENGDWQ